MTTKQILLIVGAAVAVLALSRVSLHFGYVEEDRAQAAKAIAQFHERIENGQFGKVYDDADEELQRAAPREILIDAMQKTRNLWGKLTEVTYLQTNVVMNPEVQVRAVCNVTFERGAATEMFIFMKRNRQVKLAHYEIHQGTFRPSSETIPLPASR